jgi:hypothetical protein
LIYKNYLQAKKPHRLRDVLSVTVEENLNREEIPQSKRPARSLQKIHEIGGSCSK